MGIVSKYLGCIEIMIVFYGFHLNEAGMYWNRHPARNRPWSPIVAMPRFGPMVEACFSLNSSSPEHNNKARIVEQRRLYKGHGLMDLQPSYGCDICDFVFCFNQDGEPSDKIDGNKINQHESRQWPKEASATWIDSAGQSGIAADVSQPLFEITRILHGGKVQWDILSRTD